MQKQELISFLITILIALSFRLYVEYFLPDIKLEPILINKNILLVIDLMNLTLIWLIGKKILDSKRGLLAALLYGISPWSAYLYSASSIYIFFLFLILIDFWTILKIQLSEQKRSILFVSSTAIIICGIILFGISKGERSTLDDIGILNTVNQFRGEVLSSNFATVGRFIENRYTYFVEYMLFNTLRHFAPSIYFTSELKLLNFSFSPPIFLGLLIPFLWTIFNLVKNNINNYVYLLTILLIVPSIIDKNSPNLNKLIIFSPMIFLIISHGIVALYQGIKNKYALCLFLCFLFLTIFQLVVVLKDIAVREPLRYQKIIVAR